MEPSNAISMRKVFDDDNDLFAQKKPWNGAKVRIMGENQRD